ncbi:MAG: DEAD/DEAH box helicase [Fuerstiella sp.]
MPTDKTRPGCETARTIPASEARVRRPLAAIPRLTGKNLTTFDDLDLIPPLRKALREEKYDTPTPIQAQTIPPGLEGRDILGCAQTGTGKTAAFALPILDHFASNNFKVVARRPLALILAPTRELAIQIGDSFDTYGRHVKIRHALIYGGVGQGRQVSALEKGVHTLIATPGRLLDLMNQEYIYLNRLQIFVLDEADRMLDMGFLPDLKRIIKALPIRRQSMFFSATMPQKIVRLAEQLLHDPVRVDVAPKKTNVELIDQRVIHVEHRQKKPLLLKLIKAGDVGQAIVFTRTKRGANYVAEYLRGKGIEAAAIHGNKSQNARQQALDAFRKDKIQILVATDLAARGIDVEGISHVFNFELPLEPESYVHRIGRTGRAGATGIAIAFCSSSERSQLKNIEKLIGFQLLPDGREPDPLPPEESGAKGGSTEQPRNAQNRRRRRPRSTRGRGETTAPVADPGSSPRTRPTAADRKTARNRRRRKAKKDDA